MLSTSASEWHADSVLAHEGDALARDALKIVVAGLAGLTEPVRGLVATRVDLHVRVVVLLEGLRVRVLQVGITWQVMQVVVLPVLGWLLWEGLLIIL